MIDDYAAMARAALALYEVTGETAYIDRARTWCAVADKHYWDNDAGGYFFTADDAEALIVRTKTAIDNATPSGNGVMVGVLARLFLLTGETAYRDRAEAIAAAFAGDVNQNPFAHAVLINNLDLLNAGVQTVIVGEPHDDATGALIAAAQDICVPNLLLSRIAPDAALPPGHPAHGKGQTSGKSTAYVCQGPVCSLPITDPEALRTALEEAA
jgi:hypothetical protein